MLWRPQYTSGSVRRVIIKRLCDSLGIHNFIPRSYIEQVQLLRLTQEFATMTEQARKHFDVLDDSLIIDDHVIGASPARKLLHHSAGHLRHSTNSSLHSMCSEPMRQMMGFKEGGSSSIDSPRGVQRECNDKSLASAVASAARRPVPRGAISREVQALNLEHGETPEDASTGCLPRRGSESRLHDSIPQRAEPSLSAAGKSAWHGSQDRDNKKHPVPGFGWCPNGKAPDPVTVAMDLRADLKAVTRELRAVGQVFMTSLLMGGAVTAVAAGFALGVAVSLALFRR
jgi:hypothetical protein